MSKILMEGEYLAKAFTAVSLDEFKEKKGYGIPSREIKNNVKILVGKIKSIGIRKALKRISTGFSNLWVNQGMSSSPD